MLFSSLQSRIAKSFRSALLPALALIGVSASSLAAPSKVAGGVVPQGFWVLNQARSRSLNPGRQTLWIVKDDGRHLVWTSVVIDDQHRALIVSFDGGYGGPPAPVVGTPMTTRIERRGRGELHNEGAIAGMGNYSEDCRVTADKKRFRCEGRVMTKDGPRDYVDDFDWAGESPVAARP